MKTVVRVRWLMPLESDADVLVMGDFAEQSWPVRLITNTLANVEEPIGEYQRPTGVGLDQRFWRWAVAQHIDTSNCDSELTSIISGGKTKERVAPAAVGGTNQKTRS